MRDLISCLTIWLEPGIRRTWHRARTRARDWLNPPPAPPPEPVLPPRAPYDYGPLPDHVQQRRKPLNGHEIRLVRPYYKTFEQAHAAETVRKIQQERRTAAALASLGIDYDPALACMLGAPT